MKLTRRRVIFGTAGLAGVCVFGGGALFGVATLQLESRSNLGKLDFTTPLAIPPVLTGDRDDKGRLVYDLTLMTGQTRITPDGQAETWGVNGALLGPTMRARKGDVVAPLLHNQLPEDSTIHWHGMHLPAVMDGGPHQMIPAGETWNPTWTIENPASTLWYHPHPHGETADHVYRGIAGLFLIDDDETDAIGLPNEYGVDDVPLIIQDRNFNGDGELDFGGPSFFDQVAGAGNFGYLGDTIIVNGTWDPFFEVTRTLTRFRILNGSNARFYNLGFTDDRPFQLVATDNGLVPGAPPELNRVLVGPGERIEIVVACEPGDDVILRSFASDMPKSIGGGDTFDIINLRAAAELVPSTPFAADFGVSGVVPEIPAGARERTFTLDGHNQINGGEMDMNRIDEVIPAGALEIWNVKTDGQPHTFHIHGATFHVLEVNGELPEPWQIGPKDTVRLKSGKNVRLAVQFGKHVDPEMPYMYHCHLLKHEDNGMMGQFVVVEPGTEASVDRYVDLGGTPHSEH